MVHTAADRLAARLQERFGDDLRSVGFYDEHGNDLVYLREDIDEYTDTDVERVFRDVRLKAIDRPRQEALYVHGELQCTLRCFERATELHLARSETTGVVAAVEAGAIDDLRGTIDDCLDALEED